LNCFYLGLFTRISVLVYPSWFINQYLTLKESLETFFSSLCSKYFNKVHMIVKKKKESIDNTPSTKELDNNILKFPTSQTRNREEITLDTHNRQLIHNSLESIQMINTQSPFFELQTIQLSLDTKPLPKIWRH
jgi:hypothetical protein